MHILNHGHGGAVASPPKNKPIWKNFRKEGEKSTISRKLTKNYHNVVYMWVKTDQDFKGPETRRNFNLGIAHIEPLCHFYTEVRHFHVWVHPSLEEH